MSEDKKDATNILGDLSSYEAFTDLIGRDFWEWMNDETTNTFWSEKDVNIQKVKHRFFIVFSTDKSRGFIACMDDAKKMHFIQILD